MVTVFSPAKINLFLAVTGRRADGFHDLVSVAATLDFGDELEAETAASGFSLGCDDPAVPVDGSNLVLQAAAAFAAATGWKSGARFRLRKRIPPGAGLGGGSSNGVAALRALEQLSGRALDRAGRLEIATMLGSDCALFLAGGPVVMRGRGERIEPLPGPAAARLRGRRVLVFKPSCGVPTPWAYGRMAARGGDYLAPPEAEVRLAGWIAGAAPAEELLFNNMEPAVFEKYLALPVLLRRLAAAGLAAGMSGSGSACVGLLRGDPAEPLVGMIRAAWGGAALVREARIA